MPGHNPVRFATELSGKLASRSRHICVFLGAGASSACGLPTVTQLQTRLLSALVGNDRVAFERQLEGRNLEQVLSRLRRIAALLDGNQTLDGLTAAQASELDNAVCQGIVRELDISHANPTPVEHLAAWAARTNYRLPVELFTVNYDLLLETALDRLRVPYFDGFVGTLQARFHIELVEGMPGTDTECVPAFFVRLWKLHGSVNWAWDEHQIVRLGQPVADGRAAAIYPSDAKYEESRRVPFVVLQDRLRRALQQPETLVIISGYSFSDSHLNELLFDAAARRERSEFVALCHSTIPRELFRIATTTPNFQVVGSTEAILAGVHAAWVPPEDTPHGLWVGDQMSLCDFSHLADYLSRSVARETGHDSSVSEISADPVMVRGAVSGAGGNG